MSTKYSDPLIVVIGGAGYLGSALVRLLLNDGHRVRVFDNFLFGDDGIRQYDTPRLNVIEGDISDTCAISSALTGADIVIFLAAIVGRRAVDIPRATMRDINFLASSVVLDAAIEHGAERFIFASTESVYGMQSGVMYETGTPEPVSLYSRLKLRLEERVLNARKRAFHPTALRIATCYGFAPRMRFDLVANAFIRDAIMKQELNVFGGEQSRALVHVEDAARAILSCIAAHENLVSGELFNVGASEQNLQIKTLANTVKGLVPECQINFVDEKADLTDYHLSCSKIEKILDFKPNWTLDTGLTQVMELLREGYFSDPYSLKYHNT